MVNIAVRGFKGATGTKELSEMKKTKNISYLFFLRGTSPPFIRISIAKEMYFKKKKIFLKRDVKNGRYCVPYKIALNDNSVAREGGGGCGGFPWSECQVRKLATSHCTKQNRLRRAENDVW